MEKFHLSRVIDYGVLEEVVKRIKELDNDPQKKLVMSIKHKVDRIIKYGQGVENYVSSVIFASSLDSEKKQQMAREFKEQFDDYNVYIFLSSMLRGIEVVDYLHLAKAFDYSDTYKGFFKIIQGQDIPVQKEIVGKLLDLIDKRDKIALSLLTQVYGINRAYMMLKIMKEGGNEFAEEFVEVLKDIESESMLQAIQDVYDRKERVSELFCDLVANNVPYSFLRAGLLSLPVAKTLKR